MTGQVTNQATQTTATKSPGLSANDPRIQAIMAEVIPTGTPEYGAQAGVSFDRVQESISKLAGYHNTIQLSGADWQRYLKIGTMKETACEFCCGIGEGSMLTPDGQLQCGCDHIYALSGLTKWLIKNTQYTDNQIFDEIQKWKGVFFPGPKLQKELTKRGISLSSAGLPSQQGGC